MRVVVLCLVAVIPLQLRHVACLLAALARVLVALHKLCDGNEQQRLLGHLCAKRQKKNKKQSNPTKKKPK